MPNRTAFFVGLLAMGAGSAAFAGEPVSATATSGNALLQPIKTVAPAYPSKAVKARYQGSVTVCFTVKADGSVADAAVKSFGPLSATRISSVPAVGTAASDALGDAALSAIRRWKYPPAKAKGKPTIRKDVCQVFAFKLSDSLLPPNVAPVEKAAAAGSASAQVQMANFYVSGWGVQMDYRKAAEWAGYAARQGNASAERLLAKLYFAGQGVPQNNEKAVSLLHKSADQGDVLSQYMLCKTYYGGKRVKRDDRRAFYWCRKAAGAGLAWAQFATGTYYAEGVVVPEDDAKAVALFRRAAIQGDDQGELMLGRAYLEGKGITRSPQTAAQWIRRSAEAGNADAADDLAHMYAYGIGVAKNCARALHWYKEAAAGGNAAAKKTLQTFGKEKDGVCYAQGG